MKYKVICTGVENKKGDRFEQGETVSDKDFPAKALKWWAEIGRIEPLKKDKEDG